MGSQMDVQVAGTYPLDDRAQAAPGPLIREPAVRGWKRPFSWPNPRDGKGISFGEGKAMLETMMDPGTTTDTPPLLLLLLNLLLRYLLLLPSIPLRSP